MKIKSVLILCSLFTLSLASQAQASSASTWVRLMLATGMLDSDTLNHNLNVYQNLANRIEKNASFPETALFAANELETRLQNQMGTVGTYLANQMAPELTSASSKLKTSIQKRDLKKTAFYVRQIKRELEALKNNR